MRQALLGHASAPYGRLRGRGWSATLCPRLAARSVGGGLRSVRGWLCGPWVERLALTVWRIERGIAAVDRSQRSLLWNGSGGFLPIGRAILDTVV